MKITVIVTGQLSEKHWKSACEEYKKRLKADVCEIELKEVRLSQNPSDTEIKKALDTEGEAILLKIPKKSYVIALCIEGTGLSSEELAEKIGQAELNGYSNICFIIGSSYGLSDKVKKTANLKLSMSKLTFPHQLARVMLYETVYRCFSINEGGKYHK